MPNQEFFSPDNIDPNNSSAEQQIFNQALQDQGFPSTPESYQSAESAPSTEAARPLSASEQAAFAKVVEHLNTIEQRIVELRHIPEQEQAA